MKDYYCYISLLPETELEKLKELISFIDIELHNISVKEQIYFKKFKVPFLPYQKIETDELMKKIFQLRAELDYKFWVLRGLRKKLYNLDTEEPDILRAIKNGKEILLFDINKNFTQSEISKAKKRAEMIKKMNE